MRVSLGSEPGLLLGREGKNWRRNAKWVSILACRLFLVIYKHKQTWGLRQRKYIDFIYICLFPWMFNSVFVFHFNHRLNILPWTAKSNACKTAAFWQAIKMKTTADDILIHFDVTVCGSAEWDLKTQRGEGHLFMRHAVLHSLLLKNKDCELHSLCYTSTLPHLHDWKELLIWNNKCKKKRHLQQR